MRVCRHATLAAAVGLVLIAATAAPGRCVAQDAAARDIAARDVAARDIAPRDIAARDIAQNAAHAAPVFDPTGHALDAFHVALAAAEAGKGQVRLAFWGASHTAADLWTGHMRRQLQARTADAGHGYMMPVRWHGGLRHQDINMSSGGPWEVHRHRQLNPVPIGDYGFGGVAVASANKDAWIRVSTCVDNVCGRSADRLELWLRKGPRAGAVNVTIDGKVQRLSARAKKESVGFFAIDMVDGAHEVEIRPAGDGEVWLYGIVFERRGSGAIVDQVGIPGMRGEIWLHWRHDRHDAMVRHRDPHLIVLAYGTNAVGDDAPPIDEQRASWRRVLLRVRAAAPRASCLLVGPTDRPTKADADGVRSHRPRQDEVIAMQRSVAAEVGCGHWDAVAAMGGVGSMARWVAGDLARGDWVHLNAEGYVLLAERLLDAIVPNYRAPSAK